MSTSGARHSAGRGAAAGGVSRRRRGVQALAVIAAAGMFAAGCGGSDEGDGSASKASSDSNPAVAYAECMRENGVPEFPDPVDGGTQLQATPGSGLDPNSPEWKAAQRACQDLAPAGTQSGGSPPRDVQAQVLDYAKCIRENGVPDFPDPSFEGGAVQLQPGPGVDPSSKQFESAQRACQNKAPQGLGATP